MHRVWTGLMRVVRQQFSRYLQSRPVRRHLA